MNQDYDYNEFLKPKLKRLYKKGIVVLKPMNNLKRKKIHRIIKDIPDVVTFSIGEKENRRIVLRHKPFIQERLDFKKLLKDGNEFYNKKDYNSCIDNYKKILAFGFQKSFIYAKLGLAYMKKYDFKTATDYLIVAKELGKEEKETNLDYTELIIYLKENDPEKEFKPNIKMTESDFNSDMEEYYGIDNIIEIAGLIATGISLEEACQMYKLNDEQKSIVSLIMAREHYYQGNYIIGDKYLKQIEKTKNKSKFILSLLDEIRKNKKFYINRVEYHKPLVLSQKI